MGLLNMRAVDLNLDAANKHDALSALAELLERSGSVSSARDFLADVMRREEKGKTGIGSHIAVPHGRSASVRGSCIAVGKLKHGIPWESMDKKPVKVIILFAVCEGDESKRVLHAMAQVASMLARENFCYELLHCRSEKKLNKLFAQIQEYEHRTNLDFVAVTACPTGIAHTYIAKERLVQAAHKRNHAIKVETQGSIGKEDELTPDDIREADVVIIAADIAIEGMERFAGKKVIRAPIQIAIEAPGLLFERVENRLAESQNPLPEEEA